MLDVDCARREVGNLPGSMEGRNAGYKLWEGNKRRVEC